MSSDKSHFIVALIVRDKVRRQCPQITTFEERGEPKWIRTEVPLLIYQPNALPLGQTDIYQPNALPLGQTDTLISKYTENVLFYLKLKVDREIYLLICNLYSFRQVVLFNVFRCQLTY